MTGNRPVSDRRKTASANDTREEQRESMANITFRGQVLDSAIQHTMLYYLLSDRRFQGRISSGLGSQG
jgi:hypothetical protein